MAALLLSLTSCSDGSSKSRPPASVHANTKKLIQRLVGTSATYTADLGWQRIPLSPQEAKEVPVQRLLARQLVDMQRVKGYEDKLFRLHPDTAALHLNGHTWRQMVVQGAPGVDEALKRTRRLGPRISQVLDSLNQIARRQQLPAVDPKEQC